MSINFQTFLEKTGYSATYAARSVLYYKNSRPALLAVAFGLDVEGERSTMIQIVAGNEVVDTPVKTDSRSPKQTSENLQLEIIESSPDSNANTEEQVA